MEGCLFVVIFVCCMFAATALNGWLLMLLCGVIWGQFHLLSPIGYWPSFFIAALVQLLVRLTSKD